jgi:hypothetical protein
MIHIFTYAHKRPDFIKLQFESIKKHVKSEYEYVVFNNAIDSIEQYNEIHKICEELNVKCVDIVIDQNIASSLIMGHISNNQYSNANVGTSYPIIYTFKHYLTDEPKICIIDSDMFFIQDINFEELMADKDVAYIPQYRDNNNLKYMWNALVCLNFERNEKLKNLDWNCDYVGKIGLDVGGKTRHFLAENQLDASIMEEYCIYDYLNDGSTKKIHFILNGNINYNLVLDQNNNLLSFSHIGGDKVFDNKSFPHEPDFLDYSSYILSKVNKIIDILDKYGVDLPNPKHIGFIGFIGSDDYFVVHYKSGSNYLGFTTKEYNDKKTNELKKIL